MIACLLSTSQGTSRVDHDLTLPLRTLQQQAPPIHYSALIAT